MNNPRGRPQWLLAGLVALALLGLGEAAPGAFPVMVAIDADGDTLTVSVDGASHHVTSPLGGGWQRLQLEQPGPLQREYQIDGSDLTAANDRQVRFMLELVGTPLYALSAWLRDEASLSRWEHARVVDSETGAGLAEDAELPARFRVEAALRRPEAPARVWLVRSTSEREGLELDRNQRNARWVIERDGVIEALPRWFFPEQSAPFFAGLLQLAGRSVAAAYALAFASLATGNAIRALHARHSPTRALHALVAGPWRRGLLAQGLLGVWLLAAAFVSVRLYRQLPHILDAVSYTFQAGVFASGALWLPAPPLESALRGPFQVVWQDRWFSQYPPGASLAYAAGQLVGLQWLVGPLACVALVGATSWTAGALFGPRVGLLALGLGVISPFILFQAGAYLSHPIAGGLLACALAACVAGERSGRLPWFGLAGVLLGCAFLTREVAAVLFVLPLAARLLFRRRWRALELLGLLTAPFVVVYLAYNALLTGSPLVLPRALFSGGDQLGFGDGVGFYLRHTLAAGLVNTDQQLTILQFDLFGWPPLASFGLLVIPFLFGRAQAWDVLAAAGVLAFVVAYAAYFYHGVALGPRYYFEALPWLLLLCARGAQELARLARSDIAVVLVLGGLVLHALIFYVPAALARRADFSALPDARAIQVSFVRPTLFGPRMEGVPPQSLVFTDDWWLFNLVLAPLNCARLADCPAVFALVQDPSDIPRLHEAFPNRTPLRAVEREGRLVLE